MAKKKPNPDGEPPETEKVDGRAIRYGYVPVGKVAEIADKTEAVLSRLRQALKEIRMSEEAGHPILEVWVDGTGLGDSGLEQLKKFSLEIQGGVAAAKP